MAPIRIANDRGHGFASVAFGVPIERLHDLPALGKAGAILGGAVATAISMRLFLAIVGVLIATQFLDYWLGTERANAEGRYDDQRGRSGRVAKLGGLLLILVVRLMEGSIAMAVPVLDSHGAFATAAAIALWRAEAQSAETHILALGGKGIPVLSQVLAAIRSIEQFIMPKLPPPPPAPAVRPGVEP